MDRKDRAKLTALNAFNWSNNILSEVNSETSEYFPEVADKIRQAISLIVDADRELRFPKIIPVDKQET